MLKIDAQIIITGFKKIWTVSHCLPITMNSMQYILEIMSGQQLFEKG